MISIVPGVYQISLGAVNCFLLEGDSSGLTLVDTGYEGSIGKIFASMKKAGRSPSAIRQIILTHSHPDHAGSAAAIVQETGARVIAHPSDAALAEKGIAGRLPHVLSPGIINWLIYTLFIKNKPNAIPAVRVDQRVEDGDVLPIAGGIRIVHTPGHSAGHIALYLEAQDLLIAGDICANMMGPGLSTVYEDRALGIQSIRKATEIPFGKAVFGHGKPILKDASALLRKKFG